MHEEQKPKSTETENLANTEIRPAPGAGRCALEFDRGTLLLRPGEGGAQPAAELPAAELPAAELPAAELPAVELPGVSFDRRVGAWRAPAWRYRQILTALVRAGVTIDNAARGFGELPLELQLARQPFPYQSEAVAAWFQGGRRGVVVLPTGAGKTYVAQLIAARLKLSALVITPTLDLMQQWYSVLAAGFDCAVGLVGGGHHDVRPLTVTTYDSAYLHMERLGNRFGLIVFDECHHLPSPAYAAAAELAIAPFRLGLTATPEREDGERLERLIGPIVYRREVHDLAGAYLAEYETVALRVQLSAEERQTYEQERQIYRDFVTRSGLRFGTRQAWSRFLWLTSSSEEGRRALLAYRSQKQIAQASGAKLRLLERLLLRHCHDRVLIFTSDNATVYRISRQFLIPAITHQTRIQERHTFLERFNRGDLPFLVTSRVLNEGVDVPAANIGIVLSGSGSVREHVQRLGRILRRQEGKQAVLYEVVTEDTAEEFVSSRRRQHHAYREAPTAPSC